MAQLGALLGLNAGLGAGCSSDTECHAFDFEPDPAVLTLELDGNSVCEFTAVNVQNSRYPDAAPDPEERTAGFNAAVLGVAYNELCEVRIAAWYDAESGQPLELTVDVSATIDEEAVELEPLQVEFKVVDDGCGGVAAEAQIAEVKARE